MDAAWSSRSCGRVTCLRTSKEKDDFDLYEMHIHVLYHGEDTIYHDDQEAAEM